jgi:hypothetical protein
MIDTLYIKMGERKRLKITPTGLSDYTDGEFYLRGKYDKDLDEVYLEKEHADFDLNFLATEGYITVLIEETETVRVGKIYCEVGIVFSTGDQEILKSEDFIIEVTPAV